MEGNTIKLIVPISKNNPVRSVPSAVNILKETSSYCHTKNIIRTIWEIARNHITKVNSKEYLVEKLIFLNIIDKLN